MTAWEECVERLIGFLENYETSEKEKNIIVVGRSGSYITGRKQKLRVYMNGGYILGIPIKSGNFAFGEKYYRNSKTKEPIYDYLDKKIVDKIIGIENIAKGNKFIWDNNKQLLEEYLGYMEIATRRKFENTSQKKERMYQTQLFKHSKDITLESDIDIAFMDFEFQTITEMQYRDEEINKWKEDHKEKEKDFRRYLRGGKPDYIAVDKKGFYLVELKTSEAIDGACGIKEHEDDFKKLIEIDKENYILRNELKERLEVMMKYNLLNAKGMEYAEHIVNKDIKELIIDVRYLFVTNDRLKREKCLETLDNEGIARSKAIFVQ